MGLYLPLMLQGQPCCPVPTCLGPSGFTPSAPFLQASLHPSTLPLPPSEWPLCSPPCRERAHAVLTCGTSAAALPRHQAFNEELIAGDTAQAEEIYPGSPSPQQPFWAGWRTRGGSVGAAGKCTPRQGARAAASLFPLDPFKASTGD